MLIYTTNILAALKSLTGCGGIVSGIERSRPEALSTEVLNNFT